MFPDFVVLIGFFSSSKPLHQFTSPTENATPADSSVLIGFKSLFAFLCRFGFPSFPLWQKACNTGCFLASLGLMLFTLFQATPPVYFSDTERDTSKLLFILAVRATALLLLRATTPAEPTYSSVCLFLVVGQRYEADQSAQLFRAGWSCRWILFKPPLGHTLLVYAWFCEYQNPKGGHMRFYTKSHKHYCGIDLHAKKMYVCVLDGEGNIVLHRNINCNPKEFLKVIAPFQEGLVVGVECMFSWYWLSDLCRREKIEFVLGHALYMKAIHGGKAKSDKIDAHKIAVLLRGGTFPLAYVYPPEMRATRDLMRRRNFFVRRRADLMAHIQNTATQYNLPELDLKLTSESDRHQVAELFPNSDVRRIIECDITMIDAYDNLLKVLEPSIEKSARQHNKHALTLLRSINGVGNILALVLLYEIHDINRFETVQDFSSYCRLVKCSHESAGKKKGSGGAKIGNAHLKWAFSEAAILFIRHNAPAKKLVEDLAKIHGKGKALAILSHKLARAIFYMLKNNLSFDREKFLATA